MKMPGRLAMIVAALLCAAPLGAAAAGKYDGSVPLLCVPTTVSECLPDGECKRVTADSVNLPPFFKVDIKGQKVHSEDTGRVSPFGIVERTNGNVILLGSQAGRGWTMTISEDTGKMSAAVSTGGEGWVLFGACSPLP